MHRWHTRPMAVYGAGLLGGTLLGGAAYLVGEVVLGGVARVSGDFVAAAMDLLAIALLGIAVAIGVGEPVYRLARERHPEWGKRARRQLWKGGFLGGPAVIALLSLMEMDWPSIMSGAGPMFRVLLYVIGAIQYVVTAPLRLTVDILDIPPEAPIVLALPLGAICVRYFSRPENMLDLDQPTDEENHGAAPAGG